MRIPAKELSDAKSLCTVTELRLIESSHGPVLEKADAVRLKKKIALARELRDKWRDLFERQRREVQQNQVARVNEKNQRSETKISLFASALARFEEQLAKVSSGSATPAAKKTSSRATPVKAQRVQAHRVTRSRTKEQLKELQVAKSGTKKPTVPAPAATTAVTSPAATSSAGKVKSKLPVKKVAKLATAKAVRSSNLKPTKTAAKTKSALPASIAAKAAAKSTRIKVSGKDSRVRGHVSAAGKRSQARRDGKK